MHHKKYRGHHGRNFSRFAFVTSPCLQYSLVHLIIAKWAEMFWACVVPFPLEVNVSLSMFSAITRPIKHDAQRRLNWWHHCVSRKHPCSAALTLTVYHLLWWQHVLCGISPLKGKQSCTFLPSREGQVLALQMLIMPWDITCLWCTSYINRHTSRLTTHFLQNPNVGEVVTLCQPCFNVPFCPQTSSLPTQTEEFREITLWCVLYDSTDKRKPQCWFNTLFIITKEILNWENMELTVKHKEDISTSSRDNHWLTFGPHFPVFFPLVYRYLNGV